MIKKKYNFFFSCYFLSIFGHLSPGSGLDPDPDPYPYPDPYWPPSGSTGSGSGSGSVKNEYGSETLGNTVQNYLSQTFRTKKGDDFAYKNVQGGDALTTYAICPPYVCIDATGEMYDYTNVGENENADPPY